VTLSAGTVSLGVKSNTQGFGKKLAADIKREASSSGLSDIGKGIGNVLKAGMAVALVGIGAIAATGIGEALDASKGTAQLAAGIKSTGNAANVSVKGMNDLASAIQGYSGQTDDSIVKSEQLLLTFTNIKNSGPDKIFDLATKASADMAAKMGGDASGSAILLGKALNDPVKGITALTRVGVSFTQGQKDSIAAMVASGNTIGAQKVILAELNKEFGGAAKAAGDSLPGQLAKGKRAFEDLSQSVVETLLPLVLPAITKISTVIKDVSPIIQTVATNVRNFLVQAFKDAQPAIAIVWGVLKSLGSFFVTTLVPAIAMFGGWVKDNAKWLLGLGVVIGTMIVAFKAYNAIMGVIKIATIAWTVVQGILNGTLIANPIGLIVMAVAGLVAAIIWVATQTTFFQDVWKNVTGFIVASATWFVGLVRLQLQAFGVIFSWIWTNIIKPVTDFIGGAITNMGTAFGIVFGAIGGIIKGAFNGVVDFVKSIFNDITGVVNGIIDGINTATGLGKSIGINIGKIPHLPKLADSGTVLPRPGGTLAVIAEGGKAESVVDTGKLNNLIDAAASGRGNGFPDSVTLVDADGSIMAHTHVIAKQESKRTLNRSIRRGA
jgi:phage-related protein